jgi:hypothetical protein
MRDLDESEFNEKGNLDDQMALMSDRHLCLENPFKDKSASFIHGIPDQRN